MGFFKSIGNVLGKAAEIATLPVTLPANLAANANIPIISPAFKGVADLTNLPSSILQGQSAGGILRDSFGNLLPAAGAVATGGASLGLNLGFDPNQISGLTDLFGNNQNVNPVKSAATYQTPAPATPLPTKSSGSSPIVPVLIISGLGVAAVLVLRKGRK